MDLPQDFIGGGGSVVDKLGQFSSIFYIKCTIVKSHEPTTGDTIALNCTIINSINYHANKGIIGVLSLLVLVFYAVGPVGPIWCRQNMHLG